MEVAALPAVLPLADFPSDLTACWLDLPAFFAVWAEPAASAYFSLYSSRMLSISNGIVRIQTGSASSGKSS